MLRRWLALGLNILSVLGRSFPEKAVIAAAKDWDLEVYDRATQNYLQAVEQDITRTQKAVSIVTQQIN